MTDHDGTGTGPERPTAGGSWLEDDIAVGAVLDDEATEAELARVLAEPRLLARLEELRRVRSLLGPVDDAAGELPGVTAPVTAIDPRRRRADRPSPPRRVVTGRVAAAAVLAVVVLGGAVLAARGGDGDSTATSSAATTDAATTPADSATDAFDRGTGAPGGAGEARDTARADAPADTDPNDPVAGAAPDAAADATAERAAGGPLDLGEVADAGALAGRTADLTPGLPPGTPCAGELAVRRVTSVATARLDGTDVVVGAGPDGVLVVLDRSTCRTFGG